MYCFGEKQHESEPLEDHPMSAPEPKEIQKCVRPLIPPNKSAASIAP